MICGDCTVPMLRELSCGHLLMLPCFNDPEEISCQENVRIITITRVGQVINFVLTNYKLL